MWNFLRTLLPTKSPTRPRRPAKTARLRPSFRPQIEGLEQRQVLSSSGNAYAYTLLSPAHMPDGNHLFYLTGSQRDLYEYTPAGQREFVSEGPFRSVSAGQDYKNQSAVAYAIEKDFSLIEFYRDGRSSKDAQRKIAGAGMENGPGSVAAISAGALNEVFAIALKDHSLWKKDSAGAWHHLSGDRFDEISSGISAPGGNGRNVVYAIRDSGDAAVMYTLEEYTGNDNTHLTLPNRDRVLHVSGTFDGGAYAVTISHQLALVVQTSYPYLMLERIPEAGKDVINVSVGTDAENIAGVSHAFDVAYVVHSDLSVGAYYANCHLVLGERWDGVSQVSVAAANNAYQMWTGDLNKTDFEIAAGGDGVAFSYNSDNGLDVQVCRSPSGLDSEAPNAHPDSRSGLIISFGWLGMTIRQGGTTGGTTGGGGGGDPIDTRSHGSKEHVCYQ